MPSNIFTHVWRATAIEQLPFRCYYTKDSRLTAADPASTAADTAYATRLLGG
jgi:hypothetical protein